MWSDSVTPRPVYRFEQRMNEKTITGHITDLRRNQKYTLKQFIELLMRRYNETPNQRQPV